MTSASIALPILDEVRRQYEVHPYPDYHLLLPVRRQEAYASTAVFAARLLREQGKVEVPALYQDAAARILIAGCGDTFPLLLARWEPRQHQIDAIDLSKRNIVRARARLGLGLVTRPIQFYQGALEESELLAKPVYSHVDAYGVLHHTPNPAALLARLAASMLPGATLRLMVYNSPARLWIHHLQRSLRLLGIDPYLPRDLQLVRELLQLLEQKIPEFRAKLAPLRSGMLSHDSRLVDTFLHAREARLDFSYWWRALDQAGLRPYGLFDRYAELDDLPSPLSIMPSLAQLQERAEDGRFENNLELFCFKPLEGPRKAAPAQKLGHMSLPWGIYRCGPPTFWSSFTETVSLSFASKLLLWGAFRKGLVKPSPSTLDAALKAVPLPSLQRLARIGALWPSSLSDAQKREATLEKIHEEMEAPARGTSTDLLGIVELRQVVERILLVKNRSLRFSPLVFRRLEAAARLA